MASYNLPSLQMSSTYLPPLLINRTEIDCQLGELREESRNAADRLEESEAVQRVHAGRVIDLKKEVHTENVKIDRRGEGQKPVFSTEGLS